jgi:hypothetical protein
MARPCEQGRPRAALLAQVDVNSVWSDGGQADGEGDQAAAEPRSADGPLAEPPPLRYNGRTQAEEGGRGSGP